MFVSVIAANRFQFVAIGRHSFIHHAMASSDLQIWTHTLPVAIVLPRIAQCDSSSLVELCLDAAVQDMGSNCY